MKLCDLAGRLIGDRLVNWETNAGLGVLAVTFKLRHLKAAAQRFGIPAITPPEAWKEMGRNEKK